jgi:hypothetical protein
MMHLPAMILQISRTGPTCSQWYAVSAVFSDGLGFEEKNIKTKRNIHRQIYKKASSYAWLDDPSCKKEKEKKRKDCTDYACVG